MRRVACFVLACAVVSAAAARVWGRQQTPALVLDGAQVIDGTGDAPIPSARVVVQGGRITAIGPLDRTPAPAGAARMDLTARRSCRA
jgi:hypothetical protein